MANDTDIFGAAASQKDPDIFKDVSSPSKEEPQAAAPRVETEREAAIRKGKEGAATWGQGFAPKMEDLGVKLAVATGNPYLGAAVGTTLGVLPDAVQMVIGGKVGQTAAEPATNWLSQFLMRSALKPSSTVNQSRAEQAVKTLLDEGINVTEGGVDKGRGIVGALSNQVDKAIAGSGARISTADVADYVPQAYERFKNGPLAVQAINDLGKVQSDFIGHPNILGAKDIPVQVAQEMKTGYQRAIGDKGYGLLKTPETEGEKQIARGLREKIGQAVPSVVDPLAREANLISALKLAERRVAVDANKNPIGLGALVSQPWMFPVWMWDRSPLGKSVAARMLYSGYPQTAAGSIGALYANQQGALYKPE